MREAGPAGRKAEGLTKLQICTLAISKTFPRESIYVQRSLRFDFALVEMPKGRRALPG